MNYYISFNPRFEQYKYQRDSESYSRRAHALSVIPLENNAYEEYPAIRFFFDAEVFGYTQYVRYEFRTGLLGLTVLRDYKFTNIVALEDSNAVTEINNFSLFDHFFVISSN